MKINPIRVLFVHSSAGLYGSDNCLYNMVLNLNSKYEKFVILPEEGPLAEKIRKCNTEVIIMNLGIIRRDIFHPIRFLKFLYSVIRSVFNIVNVIKKKKIDIIHTNVSIIPSGTLAAYLTRVPHVFHIREIYTQNKILTELLTGFIIAFSQKVICISNAVKEQFGQKWKTDKLVVIHDGLNINQLQNRFNGHKIKLEFNVPNNFKVVGTIGRINLWKGHDYLLLAAKQVLQRGWKVKFFIVGDVYKDNRIYKDKLYRLAMTLGIENEVIFTGFRQDIPDLLDAFDIFVLPSASPEPLGIIMLEAMGMGKPVIATASGGPLDVVINDETGFLVPPRNPSRIADAIIQLLNNAELRKKFGQAGRERVKTLFSLSEKMVKLESIYEELTNRFVS